MTVFISRRLYQKILANGETTYPEEGAGLLIGVDDGERREVQAIYPLLNERGDEARHNRYLITPRNLLAGEQEAARRGLDVLGVFHSHPDHPNRPSEFDREWALPWFSYLITSIDGGQAADSRCWRLSEDRGRFFEEPVVVVNDPEEILRPGESIFISDSGNSSKGGA